MDTGELINTNTAQDSTVDLNADHYSVSEMLSILGLYNLDDLDAIYEKTDYYIQLSTARNNPEMATFFSNIQQILVETRNNEQSGTPSANLQTEEWISNQVLPQNDPTQSSRITDRSQIETYNNDHVTMNSPQLGIANVFNVPVVQGNLNPLLTNTNPRFIVLDSQYRQSGFPLSTDYVADLSDIMNGVLSIRLYSIQLPYSWYNFSEDYANTTFYLRFSTNPSDPNQTDTIITLTIPSGNYTVSELVDAINTAITSAGFVGCVISYDSISNKMTFTVSETRTYNATPVYRTDIVFYETTFTCAALVYEFNQTLGWYLGFRNIAYNNVTSITGEAVVNMTLTKYVVLSIDDYNQNHINNEMVSITEISQYIKVPDYVSCSNIVGSAIYGTTLEEDALLASEAGNNIMNVIDKTGFSYKRTPYVVGLQPDGAQTLTQSQMYTANQILRHNRINTNYRTSAPTIPNVLAVIPVKPGPPQSIYVEFGGSVQDNKRTYFGPVTLERLRVRLYTDTGVLINLNGLDWSITIIADILYQF